MIIDHSISPTARFRVENEEQVHSIRSFVKLDLHRHSIDYMIAQRISHYDVIRKIGSGGMGEVYLVEDTRLRRQAALKVLSDISVEFEDRLLRFQLEARAASALNHPNIVTIYDIGVQDKLHYIATEYIEGKTLREQMQGGIPLITCLDIAIQIGEALAAAHDVNIVHRDVKPENVMVRPDGYVKVLDFGLAKLTSPDAANIAGDARNLTAPGRVIGTARYMSPEQILAYEVDGRSDLFGLAVVLYEMIAGRAPFTGFGSGDTLAAILGREAQPLNLAGDHGPALEDCIQKALSKDKTHRQVDVRAFILELRRIRRTMSANASSPVRAGNDRDSSGTSTEVWQSIARTARDIENSTESRRAGKRRVRAGVIVAAVAAAIAIAAFSFGFLERNQAIDSIAVLPFINAGGQGEHEYLADGLSESIIHNLSSIPALRVMARSTVARYRQRQVDPIGVGKELKVEAVLTGRLIARGQGVRVEADLVEVGSGRQLWGKVYDLSPDELPSLQSTISRTIASELHLRLSGEQKERVGRVNTHDSEAYRLYLKGRYHLNRQNPDGFSKAVEHFEAALRQDSSFALAYAGLADAYYHLSNIRMAPSVAMPKAKIAAQRALELDSQLAEARTSLALVTAWYDWNLGAAEQEFQRAIRLNSNYGEAHRHYGDLLIVTGRFEDAVREKRLAQTLDPVSLSANLGLARALMYAGRVAESELEIERTMNFDPSFDSLWHQYAWIAMVSGNYPVAIARLRKGLLHAPESPALLALLASCEGKAGNVVAAEKALSALRALEKKRYILPVFLARANVGLGRHDEACKYLEAAFEARSESMLWLKVDQSFADLGNHPRFKKLMLRIDQAARS